MSNGWGSYRCTPERDLQVYDTLPPPARDLLKYTVADWAAPGILENLKEIFQFCGSRRVAMKMVDDMIRISEPEDTYRTYGPDHPQANAHGRPLRPDQHRLWSQKGRAA